MPRTRPPFAEKPVFDSVERIARGLRLTVAETALRAKRPLQAEALACSDILCALYWQCLRVDPRDPDNSGRDRLIFNHRSASLAYYAALAKRGFFPETDLEHFDEYGQHLPLYPSQGCVPGMEWSCGTSVHGLAIGVGMALAASILSRAANVYVLLDDRVTEAGIVWESAHLASRLQCGNLTAIIVTHEGSSGPAVLQEQWRNAGWTARTIDGHHLAGLVEALQPREAAGAPVALIARTTSGKGLSFAEIPSWQDRVPTAEEIETARKELLA